jgi:hypothetical protein
MNNFPRLPTGRGRIHVPLLVVCVVFVAMVGAVVAALIWLIGQFF